MYIVIEKEGRSCIWHSVEDKYYYPGDEIDLSHLTPEQISQLIEAGEVSPTGGLYG